MLIRRKTFYIFYVVCVCVWFRYCQHMHWSWLSYRLVIFATDYIGIACSCVCFLALTGISVLSLTSFWSHSNILLLLHPHSHSHPPPSLHLVSFKYWGKLLIEARKRKRTQEQTYTHTQELCHSQNKIHRLSMNMQWISVLIAFTISQHNV